MLAELLEGITAGVEFILVSLGIPGVTLVAFLENIFPPTPSEFLYPLAGKMAYDGYADVPVVIIAGIIGSLMGSSLYYFLGYKLGEERIRQVIEKYGHIGSGSWKIHIVSIQDYDYALELFRTRGGLLVLMARLMPVVHSVVSIPAGVVKLHPMRFFIFTAVGSFLWLAPLTILGYWMGSRWEEILEWTALYGNIWYVVFAIAFCYWIYRRIKRRRNRNR